MTAKKIMIFDDNEEFANNLVETLTTRYDYEAELISSVTKLDAKNWNNYWDCIVSDVDFDGQEAHGHIIIRNRIVERHLDCPVIVMTGKRDVDLEKIKKQSDAYFAAYLSKTDPEFESKLIRAIGQAIDNTKELALARFKEFFKNENKLDEIIAREELSDEMLGITPRESDTTIGMLIDDCLSGDIEEIEIDSYIQILWKKYEDILSGRY